MGDNIFFPLNLSLFCVAGCAADDIDNFVEGDAGEGGAGDDDADDDGGPLVYENWPLASVKTPYRGEDWSGGTWQPSCWHTPSLRMAPDEDSWEKSH